MECAVGDGGGIAATNGIFGLSVAPFGLSGGWYLLLASNQGPLDPQSSALTN